jgi:hypothetical protein
MPRTLPHGDRRTIESVTIIIHQLAKSNSLAYTHVNESRNAITMLTMIIGRKKQHLIRLVGGYSGSDSQRN